MHLHRALLILAASTLALVGCSSAAVEPSGDVSSSLVEDTHSTTSTTSPPTTEVDTTTTTKPQVVEETGPSLDEIDWEITWDSIGPVVVGSTLDEIESAIGPGFEVTDAGALAEAMTGYSIALDGEVLFWAGTFDPDDDGFEFLITDNPRLSLDSGLHPGMTLAEAVELHGSPRLWYHEANHGRESVVFEDGTGDSGETIFVRTAGTDRFQAGLYDEKSSNDGLFETTEYDPAGTIAFIEVACCGPGRQSCRP